MIINPYLVVPGTPPYDPDAQAFITATGLTTPTQQNAINELVLDLKSANIWTKFNALYPMITDKVTQVDIANQMKFNLKNPLDTDAAFRLSWSGGWTYSSNGALPNGTSAFANTNLLPSTSLTLNSIHLSYYSRTNTSTVSNEIGCWDGAGINYTLMGIRRFDLSSQSYSLLQVTYASDYAKFVDTDSLGFYLSTRTSSTLTSIYKNGTKRNSFSYASSGNPSTRTIYLGAANGNTLGYSTKQCAFASIGSGLNDTESQLFYQIVEKYQVALSRNINPTQSFYYNRNYAVETNLFLFNGQIGNTTQQSAVNVLVNDLKTNSLWTKMKVIYPMVGGTALSHSLNLVTPNVFNLGFNGGWTHDSLGAKPNGINGYATTGLTTPNSQFAVASVHSSYYNVTNSAGGSAYPNGKTEVGSGSTNTVMSIYVGTDTTMNVGGTCGGFVSANFVLGSGADPRGFVNISRTSIGTIKTIRNGVVLATNTTGVSNLPFTGDLNIACNYFSDGTIARNQYSDRQAAFISFGSGLTDAEAATLYTIVQNYQTALGRQV